MRGPASKGVGPFAFLCNQSQPRAHRLVCDSPRTNSTPRLKLCPHASPEEGLAGSTEPMRGYLRMRRTTKLIEYSSRSLPAEKSDASNVGGRRKYRSPCPCEHARLSKPARPLADSSSSTIIRLVAALKPNHPLLEVRPLDVGVATQRAILFARRRFTYPGCTAALRSVCSPNAFELGLHRSPRYARRLLSGGREGIRTPGGVSPTAVFKTAALSHSATLPNRVDCEGFEPSSLPFLDMTPFAIPVWNRTRRWERASQAPCTIHWRKPEESNLNTLRCRTAFQAGLNPI